MKERKEGGDVSKPLARCKVTDQEDLQVETKDEVGTIPGTTLRLAL